jgi:putative sigma-54 modulation protein
MQLTLKSRNLELNDGLRAYCQKKLAKLDKQVHALTSIEVELSVEKNPSISANQVAEATVWLKGHTLRAREASPDMKASIDELTEKLLRQIKEERDRRRTRRGPDKREASAAPIE